MFIILILLAIFMIFCSQVMERFEEDKGPIGDAPVDEPVDVPIELGLGEVNPALYGERGELRLDSSVCPNTWRASEYNICYQDAELHPMSGRVKFDELSNEDKKLWALDNGVVWDEMGVESNILCPDGWIIDDYGKCLMEGWDPVQFSSETSDADKRKWALDNSVVWKKYKVYKSTLCPDKWELRKDGWCYKEGRPLVKFSSQYDEDAKKTWALDNSTVWNKYNVAKTDLCPDFWNIDGNGDCIKKGRSSTRFDSSWNNKMKNEWARNNSAEWMKFGVSEDSLCPNKLALQSDGSCKGKVLKHNNNTVKHFNMKCKFDSSYTDADKKQFSEKEGITWRRYGYIQTPFGGYYTF